MLILKGALEMTKYGNKEYDVRISEKITLSIFEAMALTGIGMKTLYQLAEEPDCDFVFKIGSKTRFKRRLLEQYLELQHYI